MNRGITLRENGEILSWYATKAVDERLKRLLALGKWIARGNAQIIDGCFWVREYGKEGYQKIVKYRIDQDRKE